MIPLLQFREGVQEAHKRRAIRDQRVSVIYTGKGPYFGVRWWDVYPLPVCDECMRYPRESKQCHDVTRVRTSLLISVNNEV